MKKLSIESLINLLFILSSGVLIAQAPFLEIRPFEAPNFEQYPSSACVDHHHPYTNVADNLFLRVKSSPARELTPEVKQTISFSPLASISVITIP